MSLADALFRERVRAKARRSAATRPFPGGAAVMDRIRREPFYHPHLYLMIRGTPGEDGEGGGPGVQAVFVRVRPEAGGEHERGRCELQRDRRPRGSHG